MESKFYCEKCNYRTDIASCYKQHLETTLHKTGKRKERCDKTLYRSDKYLGFKWLYKKSGFTSIGMDWWYICKRWIPESCNN